MDRDKTCIREEDDHLQPQQDQPYDTWMGSSHQTGSPVLKHPASGALTGITHSQAHGPGPCVQAVCVQVPCVCRCPVSRPPVSRPRVCRLRVQAPCVQALCEQAPCVQEPRVQTPCVQARVETHEDTFRWTHSHT